jgi:hypothetical protein
MPVGTTKWRSGKVAGAVAATIALAALALPSAPARAQVYFGCGPAGCGVNVGGFGVGIVNPYYYASPYYYPGYYWPYYYPW